MATERGFDAVAVVWDLLLDLRDFQQSDGEQHLDAVLSEHLLRDECG